MTDENLAVHKHVDGFTHESPIRAFTDFQVSGSVAIGKGFRPSLQHLATYLDAMERKERWRFVQVITVDGREPTILFHRDIYDAVMPEIADRTLFDGSKTPEAERVFNRGFGSDVFEDDDTIRLMRHREPTFGAPEPCHNPHCHVSGVHWHPSDHEIEAEVPGVTVIHGAIRETDGDTFSRFFEPEEPTVDDPVNPKHYAGTACADIGELLTPNSYQTLKYNWRLGKKDDACVEIDKSLWYLDREIVLAGMGYRPSYELPPHQFFDDRLKEQDQYVIRVARGLISWCRHKNPETLRVLRRDIQTKRNQLECGSGLAV